MKTRYFLSTLLIAALGLAATSVYAQKPLELGSTIPMKDKKLSAVGGSKSSIADVKGEHGTVVTFWCNTCPWVQRYEDRFVEIANKYQELGFGFIAINSNDPVAYPGDNFEEMAKQAEGSDYQFPYVVDPGSELAVAFGAKRTPQVYLFDALDALAYQGAIDDSPSDASKVTDPYLINALEAVGAGTAVELGMTKAFGCTIKFQ